MFFRQMHDVSVHFKKDPYIKNARILFSKDDESFFFFSY